MNTTDKQKSKYAKEILFFTPKTQQRLYGQKVINDNVCITNNYLIYYGSPIISIPENTENNYPDMKSYILLINDSVLNNNLITHNINLNTMQKIYKEAKSWIKWFGKHKYKSKEYYDRFLVNFSSNDEDFELDILLFYPLLCIIGGKNIQLKILGKNKPAVLYTSENNNVGLILPVRSS